jgi:hypothetical protein
MILVRGPSRFSLSVKAYKSREQMIAIKAA